MPCLSLAAIVVLFVALRRQKKEPLIVFEEEDIRENIITYDDEGGGEEDTEAFDIATLQVGEKPRWIETTHSPFQLLINYFIGENVVSIQWYNFKRQMLFS